MKYQGSITDIAGIRVGHVSDWEHRTGCTVLLSPDGAVAGVSVRGAAPGTRETDLMKPGNAVEKVHAVLLSGGSAFGLDAASGIMRWCEEHSVGFDVGVAKVPIVPGAVLFDLAVGSSSVRPDAAMGYAACEAAQTCPPAQGLVGAGTGATVGKAFGGACAMPGGIGTASVVLPGGAVVGAIVAVNALGDIYDPYSMEEVAGARSPDGKWLSVNQAVMANADGEPMAIGTNTTIGIIATNARLDKAQCNRLAEIGHDGMAWSIRPVHTMMDGDTLFALSYGDVSAEFNALCVAATHAVARAIVNAVTGGERRV